MRIRLKDLSERTFASTQIITESSSAFTSAEWIAEETAREFGCSIDDVGDYEGDDGEQFVAVDGKPVARVIKDFGWRAVYPAMLEAAE